MFSWVKTHKLATAAIVLVGLTAFGVATQKNTSAPVSAPVPPPTSTSTSTTQVPETTTTTMYVAPTICQKFITDFAANQRLQGPYYETNGGPASWHKVTSDVISMASDWTAPSAAMFTARLYEADPMSDTVQQDMFDIAHYCGA